jgi:hypothetical protein
MVDKVLSEPLLAVRLDRNAIGQKCSHCKDVEAEYQPEMFLQTPSGWKFLCKLCAWDHAPWLVSLVNLGHYNDWEAWGGVPPSPESLIEKSLTLKDMLGEDAEVEVDKDGEVAHPSQLVTDIEEIFAFENMLVDDEVGGHQKAALVENRRTTTRYPAKFPASISALTSDKKLRIIDATTRDVGDDGIFLDTSEPLPIGTSVKLHMAFPGGDTMKVNGTVARCETHGMAVHFKHSGWGEVQHSLQHFEQAVEGLARAFSKKKN